MSRPAVKKKAIPRKRTTTKKKLPKKQTTPKKELPKFERAKLPKVISPAVERVLVQEICRWLHMAGFKDATVVFQTACWRASDVELEEKCEVVFAFDGGGSDDDDSLWAADAARFKTLTDSLDSIQVPWRPYEVEVPFDRVGEVDGLLHSYYKLLKNHPVELSQLG